MNTNKENISSRRKSLLRKTNVYNEFTREPKKYYLLMFFSDTKLYITNSLLWLLDKEEKKLVGEFISNTRQYMENSYKFIQELKAIIADFLMSFEQHFRLKNGIYIQDETKLFKVHKFTTCAAKEQSRGINDDNFA